MIGVRWARSGERRRASGLAQASMAALLMFLITSNALGAPVVPSAPLLALAEHARKGEASRTGVGHVIRGEGHNRTRDE